MKNALFTGVCTALVTPFRDGDIDYGMLEKLLCRQRDAGIPAVVLCGTTGEAPTLTDGEKLEIFHRGKEVLGERCLTIAGTGSNDTAHAVRLSREAQKAGADALLVVSPYYNKATPSGLLAHYRAVAQAVDIPVIIYNVPGRTGVDIPVHVYRELSQIPNIAGVKEASTDIRKIAGIRAACPADFAVWTGNDDLTVPAMSLGCAGVISVVSNVFPVHMKALVRLATCADFPAAAALARQLADVTDALFLEVNPICAKAAMKMIGWDCGACRLPLTDPTDEHLEILRRALETFPYPVIRDDAQP